VAYLKDGKVLVRADSKKCIACGACLPVCHHGSRFFEDDTERFFKDLQGGMEISLIAAPSFKHSFENWPQVLAWFKKQGVKFAYDAQLGGDIYLWAHVRHLQRNGPTPMIINDCPSVVSYITMHLSKIKKYLSPIHSPLGCTAIYMRQRDDIKTKIATLSPCISKTHEYDDTRLVNYNITFKGLQEYFDRHRIDVGSTSGSFDKGGTEYSSIFPAAGGIKECLEFYLGKEYTMLTSEGSTKAYHDLKQYSARPEDELPVFFDVANCAEGCSRSIGCRSESVNSFAINAKIHASRLRALSEESGKELDAAFAEFDEMFKPQDFYRRFTGKAAKRIKVNAEQVEQAFIELNKKDLSTRNFDCGACGCDTCLQMARKIAKHIDTPINCLQKVLDDVKTSTASNLEYIRSIMDSTTGIKQITEDIVNNVGEINESFAVYDKLFEEIETIALSINMISLSAAIEAAGADTHKGAFGVVADEIRKLAASSSESAKKTKSEAAHVGGAMRSINKLVAEISANVIEAYGHIRVIYDNTNQLKTSQ
jgi:Fe-S-cluster-containing hydrogenase component 2